MVNRLTLRSVLLTLLGILCVDALNLAPAVAVKAKPPPPSVHGWDFFILSTYWPPSLIAPAAHGRARWLIASGYASGGFWTHGLWPARTSGPLPEFCTKEVFDGTALGPFATSLAYFLRSPTTTVFPEKLHGFWSHEWSRHGTCSGAEQLDYFSDIYATSLHTNVRAVLAAAGIKPSSTAKYTLGQVTAALASAYGPAFNPLIGLACTPPATKAGSPVLREVRICLGKDGLKPTDCSEIVAAAAAARSIAAAAAAARGAEGGWGEAGGGGGAAASGGVGGGGWWWGDGKRVWRWGWALGQHAVEWVAWVGGGKGGAGAAPAVGEATPTAAAASGVGVSASRAGSTAGGGAGGGLGRSHTGAQVAAAAPTGDGALDMIYWPPEAWGPDCDRDRRGCGGGGGRGGSGHGHGGGGGSGGGGGGAGHGGGGGGGGDHGRHGGSGGGGGGGGGGSEEDDPPADQLQQLRRLQAAEGLGQHGRAGEQGEADAGAGLAALLAALGSDPDVAFGTCGTTTADLILFPDYMDSDAVAALPWDIILRVLLVTALLTAAAIGAYVLLQHWRLIPALFTPRPVVEVHYDLVHQPVSVLVEELHMEQLWDSLPHIAAFVEDLPVGMGIKGGIARKLLKERVGVPEPPGSFDVDVLLFVREYTPEARHAAREAVAGCHLGGLVLEPQDVEVLSKEWLAEYFISRDVTQNEVLILKTAPGQAQLYFTQQARDDASANLVRPCVHALKTEFHLVWEIGKDGTPYTASQQVCRSLVRYLKGHGSDYAFDRATWEHYRRVGLSKTELFKVLRPFHDDDRKMQTAVNHLVDIGFLPRRDLRRAGGVNMLWGLLLQEVNAKVSRYGGRFVLTSLDPDAVERWVEGKKASTASRLIAEEMRSARTGYVQADESVLDLGLLTFPPQLVDFIADGPVFDSAAFLRSAAAAAADALAAGHRAGSRSGGGGGGHDGGGGGQGGAPAGRAGEAAPGARRVEGAHGEESPPVPAGKIRWQAVQSAAAAGGALLYQVMRRAGSGSTLSGSGTGAGPTGTGTGSGYAPGGAGAAGTAGSGSGSMEDELQREVEKLREALLHPKGRESGAGAGGAAAGASPSGGHVLGDGTGEGGGGGGGAGGVSSGRAAGASGAVAMPYGRSPRAGGGWLLAAGEEGPALGSSGAGSGAHRDGPLSAAERSLAEMASAAQSKVKRQNAALKELIGASITGLSRAGSGAAGGPGGGAAAPAEGAAGSSPLGRGDAGSAAAPAEAATPGAAGPDGRAGGGGGKGVPQVPHMPEAASLAAAPSRQLPPRPPPGGASREAGPGREGAISGAAGAAAAGVPIAAAAGPGGAGAAGEARSGAAAEASSCAWLKYSARAEEAAAEAGSAQGPPDVLGSFYQQGALPGGSLGLLGWGGGGGGGGGGAGGGDDDEYVPLVADHEVSQRRRPGLGKLVMFLVGVMAIDKPSLLAAYGLMLCGLVARLCVPRVEAALFDAFNELALDQFWANLLLAMALVLADVSLTLCGQLAMEVFTRNSMRVLFRRFFEHVVFQDLPFFARLSPGELMARTSGDSLTLRHIVSGTMYKLVEGAVLFLGATAFLLSSANHLLRGRPQLALVFVAVVVVDVAEAGLLGVWLRRVNLAVRQSLGRMFGFTLSIFAHIPLVSALGLELRCVSDYRRFASDYFANTLLLNCLLHAHNALTGLLAAVLRFSLLALGGAALFDGVTTVGSLIALLSYCAWLQRGLKQASDSWARLMAGLGSVERLVELHDRGTFGAAVPAGGAPAAGAGGEGDADGGGARGGGRSLFREAGAPVGTADEAAGREQQPQQGEPHEGGANSRRRGSRRSGQGARRSSASEPLLGGAPAEDSDVEGAPAATRGGAAAAAAAAAPGNGHAGAQGSGREVAVHRRAWWVPSRPARPDFGLMLGGVKLVGVQLTTRGRADRLLLRDATMTVEAGQVAVLSGDDPEGLHGLLSLLMLRYPPYKGSLAFQLPRGALPSAAALLGPDPLDRLLRRGGRQQAQQGAEGGGGAEWEWSTFSFRHDDLRPPRSRVALISRSMTGLFRTSAEDNVAVAAPDRQVTSAEVRRVCAAVGLHEEVNALPDGYFTLLGDGSGNALTSHGLLRLAVARALLRRPALVLVEDVDAFAEALGEGALRGLLQQLRSEGAAVVVACGPAAGARWGWADVRLHLHAGALHAEGEAQ